MSVLIRVDSSEIEIEVQDFTYLKCIDPPTNIITDCLFLDWSETPPEKRDNLKSIDAEIRKIFDRTVASIAECQRQSKERATMEHYTLEDTGTGTVQINDVVYEMPAGFYVGGPSDRPQFFDQLNNPCELVEEGNCLVLLEDNGHKTYLFPVE